MPDFSLHTLDLVSIGIYLLIIIAIGFYVSRRVKDSTDYFLAGRSLTWSLIGFSLLASNMSSTSIIGMAGSAFNTGISVYNYEWMAAVLMVLFAVFILPIYLRNRIFTMPEFLERRFDHRSRYYFSAFTIFGNIFIDTAGALYAGALVVSLLYPEIPFIYSVVILAVLAGLYTIAGGLRAVIYTDLLQAVLLLAGCTAVSILALGEIGSWQTVREQTDPQMLSLIQPADDDFLPWPGIIVGVPLLGFYFWCTNQFMVQRVLGARSVDHGRWGAIFAGLLKVPALFIMVLPGIFALHLYPELTAMEDFSPDMVFPVLLFDLLPVGLRGIILIALIAAIMSSIDSTLNSASTLVTMDFSKKIRPEWNQRQLLVAGRVTTFIFMVIAAAWAPVITQFPTLWEYLQSVLAYQSPPFVAVLLLGIFSVRMNRHGAFAGLIAGHLVSLALFLMIMVFEVIDIHFLYVAPIILISSLAVTAGWSLAGTAPERSSIASYIWTPETYRQETIELKNKPWYQNYRIQSILLLAVTFAIVIWFW
ncbi:sodium:solute symporter [Natronogracilivirga saccharolytica]|uniref:Sodium:solute symporter n=1 Tax=Natronogracilivirga saccharolytica TaxID=2812953 RepID=A0A8J7RK39_9BACT|nr:sodium:solute symporter [Natronogracilivirga saccharolytica]MBP3192697.1 sodium:solute symporter [Natronogracilivirga saccharolytica]